VNNPYDYIIAGAGAAGLSLAWKLLQSPLSEKKVLIVDEKLEPNHDKTWCFWDTGPPPFPDILYKSWNNVEVSAFGNRFVQPLKDYTYYCLRDIDFKEKIFKAIREKPNFELFECSITKLTTSPDSAILHTSDREFSAQFIFQSCLEPLQIREAKIQYPLIQHFLGWEIETSQAIFDESVFTLMDFDKMFGKGVAFIYLLPWTNRSGLIEYTIFSDQLVSKEIYEEKISLYLNNRFDLKPIDYRIQRQEMGQIPMQDRPAAPWYKPRIMNMGTHGGLTKPSTGYTFLRIQKHTDAIIQGLVNKGQPCHESPSDRRYKAYDLWLLQIIHDHPDDALDVFNHLFQNNSMDEIFRFLSEDSSFVDDLKIMSSVPYLPFLRAIWKTRPRLPDL
jgi:lycopene beta-cyclase